VAFNPDFERFLGGQEIHFISSRRAPHPPHRDFSYPAVEQQRVFHTAL
jgi:hypothetical protein